jgi:hypothetical protein
MHGLLLDPTPTTLSRYVAYTSKFIASGPKYLSGAQHFLQSLYPDFDKNWADSQVQATIAGSRKLRADPIRRKLPLRTSHLEAFALAASLSGFYDDLLFATILSCAFYACHRIGELVWPNKTNLRDWLKVIKRGSLFFDGARASYHLPYHKTDRFYKGTEILFIKQEVADPIALLRLYVSRQDHQAHTFHQTGWRGPHPLLVGCQNSFPSWTALSEDILPEQEGPPSMLASDSLKILSR